MTVMERVVKILSERLGVDEDEIKPEDNLVDDLGADSLDQTELIMDLEIEFSFGITDDEAEKLKKVNEIIAFIEAKIYGAEAPVEILATPGEI